MSQIIVCETLFNPVFINVNQIIFKKEKGKNMVFFLH